MSVSRCEGTETRRRLHGLGERRKGLGRKLNIAKFECQRGKESIWWHVFHWIFCNSYMVVAKLCTWLTVKENKQGVALTGCNRTGPPCSHGRPRARPPARRPTTRSEAGRPNRRQRSYAAFPRAGSVSALQTTDEDDGRQRANQYWLIRRASNNAYTTRWLAFCDSVSSSGIRANEHAVTATVVHRIHHTIRYDTIRYGRFTYAQRNLSRTTTNTWRSPCNSWNSWDSTWVCQNTVCRS